MSAEDFDREGVAALERGEPLPARLADDPEARAAAARHGQLVERLGDATDGAQPPAGWQERVWAGIESEAQRGRGRGPMFAFGVVLLVVIVGAAIWAAVGR